MIEIRGDLWSHIGKADVICITTNGFVKSNGDAVMGRGCARQAARRYPDMLQLLGEANRNQGWRYPTLLKEDSGTQIWSYPVKPDRIIGGTTPEQVVKHMRDKLDLTRDVPGWAAIANPALIWFSANRLVEHANKYNWKKIIIPRPGCGAGELKWSDIRRNLHELLDNRFYSITF